MNPNVRETLGDELHVCLAGVVVVWQENRSLTASGFDGLRIRLAPLFGATHIAGRG